MREKDLGIWLSWTWRQVADEVRDLACGLNALGFRRGENLAIIGDNRPQLYWAMSAAQALGGVPVPLYQDAIADEMAYILDNADVRFAVVEDQEQVDKLLEIKHRLPRLETIVYEDPRGMRNYTQAFLHRYAEVQRARAQAAPGSLRCSSREVDQGRGEDIAIMLYTSGTTGKPKGVCHAHAALIDAARGGMRVRQARLARDEVLSYLPMAWVGDNLFSYAQALVAGFTVNCPESGETVMTDMREIGPTYFFAPPRVFENLLTQLMIRMEDASRIKRGCSTTSWAWRGAAARRSWTAAWASRPGPLALRAGQPADLRPAAQRAGHEPHPGGVHRRRRHRAGPVPLLPLASASTSSSSTARPRPAPMSACSPTARSSSTRSDRRRPGVEVKIADNGEVLVRSTAMLKEYYKRPDATAEVFDEHGYFRTGDAGFFDADGHLKIIDRAKDVGKLRERRDIRAQLHREQAQVLPLHQGGGCLRRRPRDGLRLHQHRPAARWATGPSGAACLLPATPISPCKPEVYDLIQECVEKVNADLAADPMVADSQVRRFLVLHKELDADDDELTRTRKVRRGFIAQKYALLVEALYAGEHSCPIETEVKFEDGRAGKVAPTCRSAMQSFRACVGAGRRRKAWQEARRMSLPAPRNIGDSLLTWRTSRSPSAA